MFRRKLYDQLLSWKEKSKGKTAVLVEGPRRVGKSTIVEAFAKKEYKSHLIIDFSAAPKHIIDLFDDISDLNYIFLQLQLQFDVQLKERNSVIVFDEVQFCPRARQAIKHLVADGRFDYIETGSLISIRKNVENILVPSEEEKIEMFPMDFEEFCWAQGNMSLTPILKQAFDENARLGDEISRKIMRDFRLYMLVGGMPQAVDCYIKTNNLRKVDDMKRGIIALYEEDFHKISTSGALSRLFDAIPRQLSTKASRYQVSSVFSGRQASDIVEELAELQSSKTVLCAFHANDPNVGMPASIDLNKFKLYLADTGLFVTLMFKDSKFTDNVIYDKLLADKLPVNLGSVYENIVAQTFAANGHKLFYHTWPNAKTKHNYEIDFILSKNKKICPIEVKSSKYKTHSSLDAFAKKYSNRIGDQILIYTKDRCKDGPVTCLPTYMSQFL